MLLFVGAGCLFGVGVVGRCGRLVSFWFWGWVGFVSVGCFLVVLWVWVGGVPRFWVRAVGFVVCCACFLFSGFLVLGVGFGFVVLTCGSGFDCFCVVVFLVGARCVLTSMVWWGLHGAFAVWASGLIFDLPTMVDLGWYVS